MGLRQLLEVVGEGLGVFLLSLIPAELGLGLVGQDSDLGGPWGIPIFSPHPNFAKLRGKKTHILLLSCPDGKLRAFIPACVCIHLHVIKGSVSPSPCLAVSSDSHRDTE